MNGPPGQTGHADNDEGMDSGALALLKLGIDFHAMAAITSSEGRFTYVNDKFCAVTQYSRSELLGQDFRILNSGYHPKAMMKELWQTILGGQVWHGELRNRAKDGSFYWVSASIVPRVDPAGRPVEFITIRTEITKRKVAEETVAQLNADLQRRAAQLESANAEMESFAYSVSHDLRAPLRSMDGFSQALLEDYGDRLDATGQDYLRRVRAGAQQMGRLIDDILGLSMVTRQEMTHDRVDLTALAQLAIAELRQQQGERLVHWRIGEGLAASGDPQLLRVMLDNLLGNAFKFTGRREQAHIEMGRLGRVSDGVFFVRDNGAGFDMTYAGRLFGAFQRMHTTAEFPGTGIGLATVQRVILRHGGRVWAEAQPDKGATFYFTLPVVEDPS